MITAASGQVSFPTNVLQDNGTFYDDPTSDDATFSVLKALHEKRKSAMIADLSNSSQVRMLP
jgi:hypothetical protein